MLAGTMSKRSYNSSSPMAAAIGWNCLGGVDPTSGQTRNPWLPVVNCPNGLRGEIRFPSCWDGINTDSADHISHMSYGGGESGPCPATHPVRIVTLFYEVMWSVDPLNTIRSLALNPTQPFVLAMGDPTGYGYHGDFFDGWDKEVLQTAIDTCTSASGVIEECEVFDLYDSSHQCRKTPDIDEIVISPSTKQIVNLPTLPGCNPVQSGPADATICKASATPTVFANPVAYTGSVAPPGASVLSNAPVVLEQYGQWTYQGCYYDSGNPRALPSGITNSANTVQGALSGCAAKNLTICGIEYGGETWSSKTVALSSLNEISYSECFQMCNGNPLELCGGPNAMSVYTVE